MKPGIVLVITDQETNAQLKKLGVDLLELRVDLFRKSGVEHARGQFQNRRKLKVPLILTMRSQKKEGAAKVMPEGKKWEMLQALVPLTDWVDIELSSPLLARTIALARKHRKEVIVSAHDFQRTPGNMGQILKKGLSPLGPWVCKRMASPLNAGFGATTAFHENLSAVSSTVLADSKIFAAPACRSSTAVWTCVWKLSRAV